MILMCLFSELIKDSEKCGFVSSTKDKDLVKRLVGFLKYMLCNPLLQEEVIDVSL